MKQIATQIKWMALGLLLTLGAAGITARAQVGSASLNGIVQDQTGAIVPDASVTLTNLATGQQLVLHSNGSGAFTFASIPSGDYSLSVRHAGFSSLVRSGVHLDPGASLTLPGLSLKTGDVSETVTVTTETATLPLDSGELSSTITAQDLDQLSIVGRDATELEKILPGFAIRNLGSSNTAPDYTQVEIGQPTPYASNGAPVAGITLKLDGANLTDAGNFGASLQNINVSFVSEVHVQTSNFGADQSNGPVVISAVTKPGTSAYHGTLYTLARTYQLNANDWISKFTGFNRPNDTYIYPGGTLSGPVPHLHKLTFFAGAEYDAQRNVYAYGNAGSAIVHALVPTQALRNGDFSQVALNNFIGPNINNGQYNTFNTAPTIGDDNSPLVNGNIAAFRNPGAMALVNGTLPMPTRMQTGTDGYNYDNLDLVNNNISQYVGRVDYAISPRNSLFVRYSFEKEKQGQPQIPYYSPTGSSVMGAVNTPGYGVTNDIWVHSGSASYQTIFTSTLTNQVYATITSFVESFDARRIDALQKSAIAYPYNGAFDNNDTQYPQLGTYTTYGGLPLGLWPDYSTNPLRLKKFQPNVGDDLTKVWGKHTIKVGIFSQRTTNNQTATNPSTNGAIQNYYYGTAGSYFADYNGKYPDGSPAYGNPHFNSGNALANFFEGQIQDWHQQNFNPYTNLYFWDTEFYAQDSWRLRPSVVVNYGVRFVKEGAWQDAHGLGAAIWNASLYTSAYNATTNPLPGITWHALSPSVPDSGSRTPPLYADVRVGFAWDVFGGGKTVLRGGFGRYHYHDAVTDVTNMFAEAMNVRYTDLQGFGGNTLEGVNTLHLDPNTYGNAGGTETYIAPTTVYGLDPNDNKEPLTNNYSLSVAQQMPGRWTLQISYVGNNSNSLMNNGTTQSVVLDNINALPIGALFTPAAATAINNGAHYNACNPTGCTPQQASSLDLLYNYDGDKSVQEARQYNRYSQILVPEHNLFANYNGLQVEAVKRLGRLNFNVNYTFSKALGILGSAADFNWTAGMDPFHVWNNYGPMNFDRSQVLNLSYSYQTRRYTNARVLGGFINNWLISGITNLQSGPNMQTGVSPSPGYYVTGTIDQGANVYSVSSQSILGTPDVSLQPVLKCDPGTNLKPNQHLNPACFGLPALGTNGQYIEPYAHGPAFFNTDLAVEKGFGLGSGRHLRLRYAAFNFLNHPLHSFNSGYASQTSLNLSNTSAGASPTMATASPTTDFGSSPYKIGRRLSEISLKFDF